MTITVESSRLRAALDRLSSEIADPSEALEAIGRQLADSIRDNLGQGIDYQGRPFKPLKVRVGVPLNDTRQHIYNRITSRLDGNTSVEVGMLDTPASEEEIGPTHQFGSVRKGIPARPFMPLDASGNVDLPQEWEDDIVDVIASALRDSIK